MITVLRYVRYLREALPVLFRNLHDDDVDDQITALRRKHGLPNR